MSNQTLSQAVQEAIKSNLSGIVAGELKDFIDTSNKQAVELERTRSSNIVLNAELEKLRTTLAGHTELAQRERNADQRDQELNAKGLALIKREAFLETKIAQAELVGVKETLAAFLKNPTVRTHVQSKVAVPVEGCPPSQYNNMGTPGLVLQSDESHTTTRTEE